MEQNSFPKFRTAIGGFNRMDVVTYIETLAQQNQKAIKALQSENDALRRQLAQYAQEEQAESSPAEEPEADETESDNIAVSVEGLQEQELAAYRRAEAVERAAKNRAARLKDSMDDIFSEALSRFSSTGGDAAALCEDLSASYTRLQDALAEMRLIYEQASTQLQALQDQSFLVEEETEE
jgi:hypothetical protein